MKRATAAEPHTLYMFRMARLRGDRTAAVLRMQVMGQNGVSHQVVADDLEGVKAVLAWLAYAPPHTGAAPPPLPTSDPVGRPVSYQPPQGMHRRQPKRAV